MSPVVLVVFVMNLGYAAGAATIPGSAAQTRIVETHNKYRCSMCNTPPLAWDAAIANNAKAYMDTGAASGHCPSRDGSISGCVGNGENMYSGTAGDNAFEWERAVNMWFASEIDCYNFDDGTNTCVAGHMTQVAWDLSTKVGCASNSAATGGMKALCMYSVAGNSNGPSNYVNHVHKCPAAKQFQYYTGAASCCNGPKTNCKNGKCGWEYAKTPTTKGCPAGNGCSIHASCSSIDKGAASLASRYGHMGNILCVFASWVLFTAC